MFNSVKQVRAAVSLVNPEKVRDLALRRVTIGLVARSEAGYSELEDFLVPADVSGEERQQLLQALPRAGDTETPDHVDLVLYEYGLPTPRGAFSLRPDNPQATVTEILEAQEGLEVALARQFPVFRRTVLERIVHAVSAENALFAVATALPNVVPNLFELPWAVSEFASDTAFLTINQVRMAFLIAAACGKDIGFAHQKAEMLAIAGGAFGWRALARELAGKIPLGGGLIPKGAIAYAGTFLVGKGLEHYHYSRTSLTRAQREAIYQQAYDRGRSIAGSMANQPSNGA